MSIVEPREDRTHFERSRRSVPLLVLSGLLAVLAVSAFQGGWTMVTNPVDPLGMSIDYLVRAPVADYFWPGMFLLGIAAASVLTVAGLLFGWRWQWAGAIEARIGYRWPWLASISIGSVLLVFEVTELFLVPFHPIMHPLLIVWSSAIVLLPLTSRVRSELNSGQVPLSRAEVYGSRSSGSRTT